jgi:hypothetical protein
MLLSAVVVRIKRLGSLAALAAAVVPSAILVHLLAEALSLGRSPIGEGFVLRHVYLGVLFALSAWAFVRTIGLGCGAAEMRRRGALVRATVADPRHRLSLMALVLAHLAFFVLTQLGEGIPILYGDLGLGLIAGLAGSLLSAILVFAFGRSVIATAIETLSWSIRTVAEPPAQGLAFEAVPRRAARVFSLFVPNRPPPPWSCSDITSSSQRTNTFCLDYDKARSRRARFSLSSSFS